MHHSGTYLCTICGEPRAVAEGWFLIAENRWEDKLKILEWSDELAASESIRLACSAAHVEELVIHWMTTGSIDYPFARVAPRTRLARRRAGLLPRGREIDTRGARQVGELAVHRESMERALNESPQSLKTILSALVSTLQHGTRNQALLQSFCQ